MNFDKFRHLMGFFFCPFQTMEILRRVIFMFNLAVCITYYSQNYFNLVFPSCFWVLEKKRACLYLGRSWFRRPLRMRPMLGPKTNLRWDFICSFEILGRSFSPLTPDMGLRFSWVWDFWINHLSRRDETSLKSSKNLWSKV